MTRYDLYKIASPDCVGLATDRENDRFSRQLASALIDIGRKFSARARLSTAWATRKCQRWRVSKHLNRLIPVNYALTHWVDSYLGSNIRAILPSPGYHVHRTHTNLQKRRRYSLKCLEKQWDAAQSQKSLFCVSKNLSTWLRLMTTKQEQEKLIHAA